MRWNHRCDAVYSTGTLGAHPSLLVVPSIPLDNYTYALLFRKGDQAPPVPSSVGEFKTFTQHFQQLAQSFGSDKLFHSTRKSLLACIITEIMIQHLSLPYWQCPSFNRSRNTPYVVINDRCQTVPSALERLHRTRAHQPSQALMTPFSFHSVILDTVRGKSHKA